MASSHPLSGLLSAMSQEAERLKIDPLAQAITLQSFYDKAQDKRTFVSGQFVKEKDGCAMFNDAPAVLLFWRYLLESSASDLFIIQDAAERRTTDGVDALVARVHDDGSVAIFSIESWRLEPYEGRTI